MTTPLASHFLRRATLPLKRREQISDDGGFLQKMTDFHCFEVTEIQPIVKELMNKWCDLPAEGAGTMFEEIVFLPAPRTWIEWKNPDGSREASFLVDSGDGWADECFISPQGENGNYIFWKIAKLSLNNSILHFQNGDPYMGPSAIRATLALINSPQIIGRKQHMPNVGLERRISRSMRMVGKFPLHAWTEITLSVTKPLEIDDGEPHEAHLTGKRALHFCRKHIRIRNGRLEYVSAHWRGDPAIGIKQSRYKVVA